MFCPNCGVRIADSARFCDKCGEEVGTEAVPVSGTKKEQQETVRQEKKARSAAGKFVCVGVSVLCCILFVLAGCYVSASALVRHAVSEDTVSRLVEGIDIGKIRVGFLEDGKNLTLEKYAIENIEPEWSGYINENGVKELLNSKFVKKFITGKLNDYIGDFFEEDGKGIIKKKELLKVLKDNEAAIWRTLGIDSYLLDGNEIDDIVDELDREGFFEQTDLSVYREENEEIFSLVHNLLSAWLLVLLSAVMLVLALGIFLMQEKKLKGFVYVGISLIVIGVVNLVLGILFTNQFASMLNDAIELGTKFWNQVMEPFHEMSMSTGGILAGVGVVCCLVYPLTGIVTAQKLKAPAKMRRRR